MNGRPRRTSSHPEPLSGVRRRELDPSGQLADHLARVQTASTALQAAEDAADLAELAVRHLRAAVLARHVVLWRGPEVFEPVAAAGVACDLLAPRRDERLARALAEGAVWPAEASQNDPELAPRTWAARDEALFAVAAAIPGTEDWVVELTFAKGRVVHARERCAVLELTSLVAEVHRRLAALGAGEAAAQALQGRDATLATVAHDLRGMLGNLRSALALVETTIERPNDEAFSYVGVMDRSITRMNRLVQDLLDVASLDAGTLRLERRPEPLGPLVEEVVAAHAASARQRQIALVADVAAAPRAAVDRGRMLQALANLVGNAIKFTRPLGAVTVAARTDGDRALLAVRDTGPGIAPEHLDDIFRPFWKDRRLAAAGTGLGLHIARSIVALHDGEIAVESTLGGGTIFSVRLPLAS